MDEHLVEQLLAVIEAKDAAIEKIACIGNGDSHGNSIGNCMAIEDRLDRLELGD